MRSKVFSAIILAGILSLAVFSTVSAAHWARTEFVAGNPSCDGGFKYENPLGGDIVDGRLIVPGGYIDIDVTKTSAGPVFSFDATGFVVSQVTVKGGPNALLYFYEPSTDSDAGLHSPLNKTKWYGLSHLCFFGDDKKAPPKK